MKWTHVTLGTRGSGLAVCQARLVAEAIRKMVPSLGVTLKTITTRGDRDRAAPLATLGGTGVFVKEIEAALLSEAIDLAVHSMKDLPTEMPEGLTIAAVPPREDARDALVSRTGETLEGLTAGSRVGTGSPRRRAQVLHLRPDLQVLDLRGNLDTRLRRLDEGRYDAIILAAAGLRRLGLEDRIAQFLPFRAMLPAAGQGVLAIQTRAEEDLCRLLGGLEDPATRAAVTAERAFLRRLGGGCHVPAAAYASTDEGRLRIEGCVAALDGRQVVRNRMVGAVRDATALGTRLADTLLDHGGREILREIGSA